MDIYRNDDFNIMCVDLTNEDYIVIRHNNTPIDGELNQSMPPVFYPKVDTEEYHKHEDNCKTFESDTGCYLTTACMKHLRETFDDNCYELTMLRWFRDKYISKEDKEHYYITAPIIVEALDNIPNNEDIYEYIYQNVIIKCIDDIKAMNYESAYARYKNMVLTLEEQFARPALAQRLVKVLKI